MPADLVHDGDSNWSLGTAYRRRGEVANTHLGEQSDMRINAILA